MEDRILHVEKRVHVVEDRLADQRAKLDVLETTVSLSLSQMVERLGEIREEIRADRVAQVEGMRTVSAEIQAIKQQPGRVALDGWRMVAMLVATSLISGFFGGCAVVLRQVVEKPPVQQQAK